MNSEKYFILMQRVKSLTRVSYMAFIHENKPDLPSSIFAWLFEKSIDLVDGIIQLHKSNLDECSQSLIRVLFETHLKYIHLVNLMNSINKDDVSIFVIESIVLLKEKSTLMQHPYLLNGNLTEKLGNLDILKGKYSDEKNPFVVSLRNNGFLKHKNCLDGITRNGFLLDSIENIARKYNKIPEYQMMYRNFSRNVHANDLVEYLAKQGHINNEDAIEARDIAAFDLVLRIFLEMMTHMDYLFCLNMKEQLKEIYEEYSNLD
ncbi:TPA: hypothetical protein I8Z04_002387 [Legionella pneumophila]|nr:hypothetical protein [Legionella pneumophila]